MRKMNYDVIVGGGCYQNLSKTCELLSNDLINPSHVRPKTVVILLLYQ